MFHYLLLPALILVWMTPAAQNTNRVVVNTDSGAVHFIRGVAFGDVHIIYGADTVVVRVVQIVAPGASLPDQVGRVIQILRNGRFELNEFLIVNQVDNTLAMRKYYRYARQVRACVRRKIPDPVLIHLKRFICVDP